MFFNDRSFANPQTLSRYIKKYVTLSDELLESVCEALCKAINSFVRNENTDELSSLFKQIQQDNLIDDDTWYQCLRATKDYLRGREFRCPNKYITRSWFWGQIKQIKASNVLDPLYKIIDDEMELLSIPETSLTFIFEVYQSIVSSLTRVTDNPIKTLIFALALQSLLVPAYGRNETSMALGDRQSQEDNLTSKTTDRSQLLLNFVDQIPYDYHVISQSQNVSLDQVEYFFLVSPNINFPRFGINFIQHMGTGYDYVLQKDVPSLTDTECIGLELRNTYRCFGWDWDVWVETVNKLHDLDALKRTVGLLSIFVEDQLGKLEIELDESFMGILPYSSNYYATTYNIKNLQDSLSTKLITRINASLKKFPELDKLNLAFNLENIAALYSTIEKSYFTHPLNKLVLEWKDWLRKIECIQKFTPQLGYLTNMEHIIEQRNKAMMATLDRLNEARFSKSKKIHNNKFFTFLPLQQVLPDRVAVEEGLSAINSKDSQFKLKEYLEDKEHAILMSKAQNRF
ncbi:hypothetical protein [Legionella sp. PC997]|uniref:hypothetical protein n=1 Tax=Legionella sp. PC997 TaxID=2755562 RepID=UPI0015F78F3E|nr:hypothetical protein [Legionella sp. PC997]QMT60030.1 hypothetical protein HBNCFIEN_01399 [Legionella sp. PC997]